MTRFSAMRDPGLARWSRQGLERSFRFSGRRPHRLLRARELDPQQKLIDDLLPHVGACGRAALPAHRGRELGALLQQSEARHELDTIAGLEVATLAVRIRVILTGRAP